MLVPCASWRLSSTRLKMETVGKSKLRTFLSDGWTEKDVSNTRIRNDQGCDVASFPSLVHRVASLTFHNRDQVLLFRGQKTDYRNSKDNTSIQPSLFRGRSTQSADDWRQTLASRYDSLAWAEALLVRKWKEAGLAELQRVERYRNLRWTILQHYEVCPTPLLDVTQSLRVAASFALANAEDDEAYLYVLGVPQISGAITVCADAELQILRLASVCPPTATRPHFQEGYLLGNYPDLQTVNEKQRYGLFEVDFARRLICKFRLVEHAGFWKAGFEPVPENALFPRTKDPLIEIASSIKQALGPVN